MAGHILIITTGHDNMGDVGRPTGLWLEELTVPYFLFDEAGFELTLANLTGRIIPIDPRSEEDGLDQHPANQRFLHDAVAMEKFKAPLKLDEVDIDFYDAVFLPGGHGAMWDLPESGLLGELLSRAWAKGKVIGAVCHGPAGLLNAKNTSGKALVDGLMVSGFTNSEEAAAGLSLDVPFLLESRLKQAGAIFEKGPDSEPFAVQDGNLITGQNPASSEKVARLMLVALNK